MFENLRVIHEFLEGSSLAISHTSRSIIPPPLVQFITLHLHLDSAFNIQSITPSLSSRLCLQAFYQTLLHLKRFRHLFTCNGIIGRSLYSTAFPLPPSCHRKHLISIIPLVARFFRKVFLPTDVFHLFNHSFLN